MSVVTDKFPDISFIDNATMDDVLTQMINDYQDKYKEITKKEISLAQADPFRLIMYACAAQIYQGMQYADYAGKSSFLKYARGELLDNLVAIRGMERNKPEPASTVLKFTVNEPLKYVLAIPAGTRATNGNDVFFATKEYAEIKVGETSVSVPAECTVAGTIGNGFAEGEIKTLVKPYVASVVNTVQTYGGADKEEDDDLIDRAYNIQNSYSTAGPTGAYIYFAKAADPTVSDAIVDSPEPGMVQVTVLCDSGLPDQALLDKVSAALQSRTIRPLTDNVIVKAPEIQSYDVNVTYYIASSDKTSVAAIQENVETAVAVYNVWQTERIGRDINPSYLIQQIMGAGAKRVTVAAPAFMIVPKDVIARTGTVSVTYGGLEDD